MVIYSNKITGDYSMHLYIQDALRGRSDFTEYEQLGFAAQCMLMQPRYSLYYVKTLQLWTLPAIQHRQIHFLFDHLGNVLAYITWAFPSSETLTRFLSDPEFLFHTTEWDEGGAPLVVDFCCAPGTAPYCIAHLKRTLPLEHTSYSWRARRGRARLLSWLQGRRHSVPKPLPPHGDVLVQDRLG